MGRYISEKERRDRGLERILDAYLRGAMHFSYTNVPRRDSMLRGYYNYLESHKHCLTDYDYGVYLCGYVHYLDSIDKKLSDYVKNDQ